MASTLTDMQQRYVSGRSLGMTHHQAATYAGYKNPTTCKNLEKNPEIREVLDGIRKENEKRYNITREKVTDMVMESYDIAKMLNDPATMLRGTVELNKMNGYYEPERREIHVSATVLETTREIQVMTDDELLKIADNSIIDADFEEIPEVQDVE